MEFEALSRRELQALCKKNKIPANITNVAMVESLKALTFVEWAEEVMQISQSGTAQSSIESPEGKEVTSPRVLPTGSRTTRRRTTATKEEPATLATTRTRRSTRKSVAKDADVAVPYPAETPATVRTTRKAPLASVCREMESQFKECEEEKKGAVETPAPSGVATRRRRGAKEESVVKKEYGTRRSVRLSKKDLEVPVEVENDNSSKDANMSLKESMDEASGTSGVASITTVEECPKPMDELEVVSAGKQQIQSDEHVDLVQDVEKNESEAAPDVKSEVDVLEEDKAILEATDVNVTTIMEEMLEGEDESEFSVNAEVDGLVEATDVNTTIVVEESLKDEVVDTITAMDEVLKGDDEPEVAVNAVDKLEEEKATDVDVLQLEVKVLEPTIEEKIEEGENELKPTIEEKIEEGENELNGSLDVSTNVEMAVAAEAGVETIAHEAEDKSADDVEIGEVEGIPEFHKMEEVQEIYAENVESIIVEAKEHMDSEVKEAGESNIDVSLDLVADLGVNPTASLTPHTASAAKAKAPLTPHKASAAKTPSKASAAKERMVILSDNKENIGTVAPLTPHKASAAKTPSKASAAKERMVILLDNKENIGTESTVTRTVEKVKVAKKKPDVDLESLSRRKLTKMVKQLIITKKFVKNEKEDKVNEQAGARPALQVLPGNQLVNEEKN